MRKLIKVVSKTRYFFPLLLFSVYASVVILAYIAKTH